MLALVLDYFLFVFVAAWGILQIAGTHNRLRGILLLRKPAISYGVGVATVLLSFLWFFGTQDRNVRGLEGMQQLALFLAASGAALVASLVGASALQRIRPWPSQSQVSTPGGLETLREMSYLQALGSKALRQKKAWKLL